MSISLLPQELVRLVMENLDSEPTTLLALALTCKQVHFEAMRVIYRSMTNPSGTVHYKFLLKIRKHRHLAQLVYVYHSPGTTNTQRGSLWGLIRACLPLMVNLKRLHLLKKPGNPLKFLPSAPKGQPLPFQLERLYISSNSGHEQEVVQFLEAQRNLKHLDLSNYRELKLSEKACPNLRSVSVHVKFAKNLLRGRHVTELNLRTHFLWYTPPHALDSEEAQRAFHQLEDIPSLRCLSIDCSPSAWLNRQDEMTFKPFLNVELLRIIQRRMPLVSEMASDVANFPRLERLVLTLTNFPLILENVHADIRVLFTKQPTLKYVDVYWDESNLYKRWVDGVPQARLLHISQVWNPEFGD